MNKSFSCEYITLKMTLYLSQKQTYHTLKQDFVLLKFLNVSSRSVTDSRVLRESRRRFVWQQMWPVRPESSEWRGGPWAGREIWVCLSFDPSAHGPLPQLFVKKAVPALFAKVCAGECQTKLVLLEKQIFVHTCEISCSDPGRHTFTKNTYIIVEMPCVKSFTCLRERNKPHR